MNKIDELTRIAGSLRDDQLDGVIGFVRALAAERAVIDTVPREALASVERGLAQHRLGETESADLVFGRLRRRVEGVPSSE